MLSKHLLLYAFFLASCASTVKVPQPPPMDKEWTLEATPNGLDNVGVIFAIQQGKQIRIPGGALEVKTASDTVIVTEMSRRKDVSFAAIANFLAVKNVSSNSSFSISDSTHIDATFSVKNGSMHVIDDNIAAAFDNKRETIISNIHSLGLEKSRLYLILETIKSPNVSIKFNKVKDGNAELSGEINKMISLNPKLARNSEATADLVYNLEKPLTIFYKLREVKIHVSKGPEEQVQVTLGKEITSDELIYERNE